MRERERERERIEEGIEEREDGYQLQERASRALVG